MPRLSTEFPVCPQMSLETNTLAYRASIFHCKIAVVIIHLNFSLD